jgi:hypothetical protein
MLDRIPRGALRNYQKSENMEEMHRIVDRRKCEKIISTVLVNEVNLSSNYSINR